jgi:hypothetical protein
MTIIPVWNVQLWDGGDRHNHGFYVMRDSTTVKDIEAAHLNSLSLSQELVVLNSLNEYPQLAHQQARQRALAKLTEQDRKVLGLE